MAKTLVVQMVRGLVFDFLFPYAMFAAAFLTGLPIGFESNWSFNTTFIFQQYHCPGLSLVPEVHLHLMSFSKMWVDLTAQVIISIV